MEFVAYISSTSGICGSKWSEFCRVVSSIFLIWGFGEKCSARRTRRGARSRTVFLFVLNFSLLFGVAISPFYVRSKGRAWVLVLPKSPCAGFNSPFPSWCWLRRILEFDLFLGKVGEIVGRCLRFVSFSRGPYFLFFGQCHPLHTTATPPPRAYRRVSVSLLPAQTRTPTRIHGTNDVRVLIVCRWSRLIAKSEEDCAEAMEYGGCWRNSCMPTDPFQPGSVRWDIAPI